MPTFKEISDKTSKGDFDIIVKISGRAFEIYGSELDRLTLEMDLIAVHGHCQTLNLTKLLGFDDFNFCHDIHGITTHLDRHKIELKDCFLPRCSATIN